MYHSASNKWVECLQLLKQARVAICLQRFTEKGKPRNKFPAVSSMPRRTTSLALRLAVSVLWEAGIEGRVSWPFMPSVGCAGLVDCSLCRCRLVKLAHPNMQLPSNWWFGDLNPGKWEASLSTKPPIGLQATKKRRRPKYLLRRFAATSWRRWLSGPDASLEVVASDQAVGAILPMPKAVLLCSLDETTPGVRILHRRFVLIVVNMSCYCVQLILIGWHWEGRMQTLLALRDRGLPPTRKNTHTVERPGLPGGSINYYFPKKDTYGHAAHRAPCWLEVQHVPTRGHTMLSTGLSAGA